MKLLSSSKAMRGKFWRNGRVWLAAALFLFWTGHVFAQSTDQPWRDHLTRQDVINALGDPEGERDLSGGVTMMIYKGELLITLTNNEVTKIDGPVPDALKPVAAAPAPAPTAAPVEAVPAVSTGSPAHPTPAATAAAAATATPVPVVTSTPAPSPPSAAPQPMPASLASTSSASSTEQDAEKIIKDYSSTSIIPEGTPMSAALSKALGPMENGSGGAAGGSGALGGAGLPASLAALTGGSSGPVSVWKNVDTWQGFLLGLLIKTIIMTAVLKGVFAYKEFPVLWREAALVAAGVSLVNQVLAWAFTLNDFGKIAGMVQADQIVAGAVLLALIMNFTAAKQFPTAAGIMLAAMTVNIAVGYAQAFLF